jgi:hypothetical protein
VHIVSDDDIALMPMSKTNREAFIKIESDLAALAKRADAQDKAFADIMSRLEQDLEKYAAANRKHGL